MPPRDFSECTDGPILFYAAKTKHKKRAEKVGTFLSARGRVYLYTANASLQGLAQKTTKIKFKSESFPTFNLVISQDVAPEQIDC